MDVEYRAVRGLLQACIPCQGSRWFTHACFHRRVVWPGPSRTSAGGGAEQGGGFCPDRCWVQTHVSGDRNISVFCCEDSESVLQMRRTFDTWLNPNLSETWKSAPEAGLGGRAEPIITGRTLGGTSAINAGQWTVPGLKDVEAWGFEGTMPPCQSCMHASMQVYHTV